MDHLTTFLKSLKMILLDDVNWPNEKKVRSILFSHIFAQNMRE